MFDITFSALSLAQFDDASFDTTFRTELVTTIADAAGVEVWRVSVTSVAAGSVVASLLVQFPLGWEVQRDALFASLADTASLLASSSTLQNYGDVTAVVFAPPPSSPPPMPPPMPPPLPSPPPLLSPPPPSPPPASCEQVRSPTVPPLPFLSLCRPLCLPHRLSHCVAHCVSLTVSLTVSPSPSLSLCLPHRLSHCVAHCVSLTVSLTVSPSPSLSL